MLDIFAVEPAVTPGADAIGLNYPLVAPAPYCVDVDVEQAGYVACGQHRVDLAIGHFSLSLLP